MDGTTSWEITEVIAPFIHDHLGVRFAAVAAAIAKRASNKKYQPAARDFWPFHWSFWTATEFLAQAKGFLPSSKALFHLPLETFGVSKRSLRFTRRLC